LGDAQGRLRLLFFGFVALCAVGLSLLTYGFGVLDGLDRQSVDERFAIRGTQPVRKDVEVVKIDDITFSQLQQQWPFPRSMHGKVIDRLRAAGAKAVVYDVQFTEPSTPAQDNALIEAVARNRGKTVLSTTEVGPKGETGIFGGGDILDKIGARAGNGNVKPDPDGILRHFFYEIQGLKSLAIVAAETATGKTSKRSAMHGPKAWIDFAGPPGSIPSVSFSRVLRGQVPASTFRNKVVVVGATAPSLQDIHATATGTGMSGPEVQANEIWTALHGFPLRSAGRGVDVFLIVLLGLLVPLIALRARLGYAIGAAVIAGALYTVAVQFLFNHGWVVSYVYPIVALGLGTAGSIASYYLVTAVERERVRELFTRFVPEEIVGQVLARTDSDLRLGGEKLMTTMLFVDLRSFTTFAERTAAEDAVTILNFYLEQMSDAVLVQGGTLVTYRGDGLMAAFGAPIEVPDHADRALAAAKDMVGDRLVMFNKWLHDRGVDRGFRIGVGLNSGTVMSGNVGHQRRLEYTTIGDTVNTAARIEEMTKGQPYMLFVSETTYEALSSPPSDLVFVDEFPVRGREKGIKIWGYEPPESPYGPPRPGSELATPAPDPEKAAAPS